ncbi:MAG TPA: phosphatase PAP2 family protein [Chthoniobacteraceae bacterium]|jgi:undecaprenyl-diphosphatase
MDQKLLFLINREWTSPAADRLMALLSSWDAWFLPALALGLFLGIKGGFRGRAFLLTLGLVLAVNDGVMAKSLKRLVDRPRPHQAISEVRVVDLGKAKPRLAAILKKPKVKLSRAELGEVEGRSFPSSHTVNMFSAALVAFCFYGRRVWWGFLLAGAVAYSRIYTGAHFPSDVVTSIFLGLGATLLLLLGLELLWRRRGETWLPQVYARHPSLFAA